MTNELEPNYRVTPRYDGDDDPQVQDENFKDALDTFLAQAQADGLIRDFEVVKNEN